MNAMTFKWLTKGDRIGIEMRVSSDQGYTDLVLWKTAKGNSLKSAMKSLFKEACRAAEWIYVVGDGGFQDG